MPLGLAGARRVPALARLLRRERPDVFHAHMSSPVACKWGLAAAVAGAGAGGAWRRCSVGAYEPDRSAYLQLRALARGVDRYIAVSREIAAELVERLGLAGGEGRGRLQRRRRRARRRRGAARAARAARRRRDAAAGPDPGPARRAEGPRRPAARRPPRCPDALFVLAGEGPERAALEALAARARRRRPRPLPRSPRGRPAAARRLRRLRPALALRGLLAGGAGGDGGGQPGRLLGDRRHRRADRGRTQRPAGARRATRGRWPRRCGGCSATASCATTLAARARERVDAGLTPRAERATRVAASTRAPGGARGGPRQSLAHR